MRVQLCLQGCAFDVNNCAVVAFSSSAPPRLACNRSLVGVSEYLHSLAQPHCI